jgi:exonuclease VII small subunit
MDKENKIKKLETIMNDLGNATDFETASGNFTQASVLVKELLTESETAKGKVYEVIKELDEMIEQETNLE